MAKRRMIDTRFWSDNFISELNPLDRYLFLYFLTNEHTNISGIYEVPLKRVSDETGIEKDMLLKMMKRLKGKVEYIDGWVALKNFAKYQSDNESVRKGIINAKALIPSHILQRVDTLWQSVDTVGTASDISELESELELEPELKSKVASENDNFNQFWKEYPRKTGKGEALRSWLKLRPSKELSAGIVASVAIHKECRDWKKDDGRFIPLPATFLNQSRWEDEVTADKLPEVKSY